MDRTAPPGTQTLVKGLNIIEAVSGGASTLSEIVVATGIGKSTAHRLAHELLRRGWLAADSVGGFVLGPALISYGFAALESVSIAEAAGPIIEDLRARTEDTVHLGTRVGDEVLYAAKLDGLRGAAMRSRVGGRMPLARTGVGMALLLDDAEDEWRRLRLEQAGIDASRGQSIDGFVLRMREYARVGAAYDLEDNEVGIRCVAAPVRDARGVIAGALSVTATTPYMGLRRMHELVPVVVAAANDVSHRLGAR